MRTPTIVVGPGAGVIVVAPPPIVIGPKPSATIEAPARFAWDEKRWTWSDTTDGKELVGRYRVLHRRTKTWREFDGRLAQTRRQIATYIKDPPVELRDHPHGACLQLVNKPWFRLHWSRSPGTLDDALFYMERLLDEAINHSWR